MAEDMVHCQLCGRPLPLHASYIVRIDVFADPSMPAVTQEEIEAMDFDKTMNELIAEMQGMSAEELRDQVHRRFEYRLCRPCQVRFLANPLGKPRTKNPDAAN